MGVAAAAGAEGGACEFGVKRICAEEFKTGKASAPGSIAKTTGAGATTWAECDGMNGACSEGMVRQQPWLPSML